MARRAGASGVHSSYSMTRVRSTAQWFLLWQVPSLEKLARRVGTKRSHLGAIARGYVLPRPDLAARIARELGTTPGQLYEAITQTAMMRYRIMRAEVKAVRSGLMYRRCHDQSNSNL